MKRVTPTRTLLAAAMVAVAMVGQAGTTHALQRAHAPASQLWDVTIGVDFFYRGFVVDKFFPDKLVIHAGDKVRWTNLQGVVHRP